SRAAQDRHAAVAVENGGQSVEIGRCRRGGSLTHAKLTKSRGLSSRVSVILRFTRSTRRLGLAVRPRRNSCGQFSRIRLHMRYRSIRHGVVWPKLPFRRRRNSCWSSILRQPKRSVLTAPPTLLARADEVIE